MGRPQSRMRRGGIRGWTDEVKPDVVKLLRQDPQVFVTTMADFYKLPANGNRKWPGRAQANSLASVEQKSRVICDHLLKNIRSELGDSFNSARFIPFITMHEIEAYMFSDCSTFSQAVGKLGLNFSLQRMRNEFQSPEHINDSEISAPKKRIQALFPEYQETIHGSKALQEIGLDVIRQECPIFNGWISRLETLILQS